MSGETNKKLLFAIFLLSLIMGIFFVIMKPLPYYLVTEYQLYARNILAGHGFSKSQEAPYYPDVYRTPGYSLFLCLIYLIFGFNNLLVMLIQVFLNALVCLFIFYLTKRYFSLPVAYFSSFMVALYPFSTVFVHVFSAEILCIFLFTLGIFLFEKGRESKRLLYFLLSGLTMGYCLLVRPGTALMFFFMSIAYLLVENFQAIWKHLLVFNLCVILIWIPWMVRNYRVSGELIPLTIEAKEELFWASGSIGKYFEDRTDNPKFKSQFEEIHRKLRESGLVGLKKELEEENLYLKYAIENIKDNPFLYLFSSLKRIPRMWISVLISDDTARSYGYRILGGKQSIFDFIKYFTVACLLLAIYGIWITRYRWKQLIFLFLPLIYFSLTHMFLLAEARFTLPARPYLLIFTVVGLSGLLKYVPLGRRHRNING